MIHERHRSGNAGTGNSFSGPRGFTFVEMLVAMSVSAMFIGTAALALFAVSQNSKHYSTIRTISIGSATKKNLYGLEDETIRAPSSPNLGRLPFVQEMREVFQEDLSHSDSLYCLARADRSTIRPEWIPWPYTDVSPDRPTLDTPESFRTYLASADPDSAGVFTSYRNVPPASANNSSLFILAPSNRASFLKVQAVYEIDYITTTSPAGTYATVRRYKNGGLTHYYDIFYEEGNNAPFRPGLVAFERRSRLSIPEGDAVDRFKVAPQGPFYLIFWPDPTINPLTAPVVNLPGDATDPRVDYGKLAGLTNFTLVAPAFPSF